jgi:phage gp29-like protein
MTTAAPLAALSSTDHLFAELVLTALAAERQLRPQFRPYIGELGADPMLLRFGSWQEIPHPSRFVRERSEIGDRVGELYTRMIETDTTLAGLWEKRVKAVLALPRFIRPADATPPAEETATFVRTALAQIPLRVVPISHALESILKGVALNEVMWERIARGPLAGAWLPVDLIDRPMWRFGWSAADRSLHLVTTPLRGVPSAAPLPAPPMKFQVLTYGTKDNPWGRALLDRLYWVWYLKKHASKYWALFVERFAQPLAKGTYPYKPGQEAANKEQQDRLLAILNTLRTGTSIALPEGLDIAFLEASRGGDASYASFLAWLDRAESLLLLGEVDTSGLAKGPGSYAKALIANEVRLETVDHDAHLLGSFETDTLIRWIVLLNFGPDAPIPKSVYDSTDAPDRDQRMRGIANALNDGVPVPLGYYRMTMRVPAPMEGEPLVTKPPAAPHPAGREQGKTARHSISPSPGGREGDGRGGQGVRGWAGEPSRRDKGLQPRVSTLGAGGEATAALASAPATPRYLVWWTAGDDKVRQRPLHNHAVMHGKVFAIDHPIWKTWWPPAGYNCRCYIGTITDAEAQALGYTGPEPTGPWPIAPDTGLPALPDPGFEGEGSQVSPSPGGWEGDGRGGQGVRGREGERP